MTPALKPFILLALTLAVVTNSFPDKIFLNRQTERLLSLQFNQTQEYVSGPLNFPRKQLEIGGLWPSTIRLNTIGNLSYWRDDILLLDNNFYVTTMVVHFLWELRAIGVQTDHDVAMDEAVSKAVPALHSFQDRNHHPDELIVSFWLQHAMNNTNRTPPKKDVYCATTANIYNLLESVSHSPKEVEAIKLLLIDTGHADLWNLIGPYFDPNNAWDNAFGIVADGDDTSIALSLTTMFLESPHFVASKEWLSRAFTSNISSYAANADRYAYRPFSNDFNVNIIDQRSYYWMRHFLYEVETDARANGFQPSIALVVTWLETQSEVMYYARNDYCYRMPCNVNNVDLSLAANAIFAMSRSLFTFNTTEWFTPGVQQVFWNTTSLMLFAVQKNWVEGRPDIVLLYYPAVSDFYWYLARILTTYRKIEASYKWLFAEYPFMVDLYQRMETALTSLVTQSILGDAQHEDDFSFWDGFIGLDDTNQQNEPTPHYYDRVFQTAMFSNALLYIWTDDTSTENNNTLQWRDDTPSTVKEVLEGSIRFLRSESFNVVKYRPDNAFFSGSYKVLPQTDRRVYPANYNVLPNGTVLDPYNCTNRDSISGVQGVIDDETYQKMMDAKPCGMIKTPTDFGGYNQYSHAWPFWNSHAITHASTLLAVARFDRIDSGIEN